MEKVKQVWALALAHKKISKVKDNPLIYKPSPHLLSSLIKYQKK